MSCGTVSLRWVLQECPSCGLCGSPVITESITETIIAIVLFVCGIDPKAGLLWRCALTRSVRTTVQVLTTQGGICLSRVWCLLRSHFGYAACEAYWILLCSCLELATGCVGSGPFGRDSGACQGKMLPVNGSGEPIWSYKLSTVWLPLLGLGLHREDKGAHQCQLLPEWAWGRVSKSLKAPRDPLCLCLLHLHTASYA